MIKNKKIIAIAMLFTLLLSGMPLALITQAGEPAEVTANNTSITVGYETQYTGALEVTNPDEKELTYVIVDEPEHGELVLTSPSTPNFTYRPDDEFSGSDEFTFKVTYDEDQESNVATVTVTVSEEIIDTVLAQSASYTIDKNTILSNSLNATNPDEEELTYVIVDEPTNGTLVHSDESSPDFSYTPDLNFVGTDIFSFKVTYGEEEESNVANITITVQEPTIPVIPFNYIDMQEHWANYSASHLAARGLIVGEEIASRYYFHPNYEMTRSEFMLFLLAVTESNEDSELEIPNITFADEDITPDWLLEAAKLAYAKGIIKGSAVGNSIYLNPNNKITRTEAVVMVNNVLDVENANETLEFWDTSQIPSWALQSVKNLVAYEIVQGTTSNTFKPNSIITRAEAAELTFKLVKELEKQALDGEDDEMK